MEISAFIIGKLDGSHRSLNNSRKLNRLIKRMPYPCLKVKDFLQKLKELQWVTFFDLNMGCYHIPLMPIISKMCIVVLSWSKYEYLKLLMGLCNSSAIFKKK